MDKNIKFLIYFLTYLTKKSDANKLDYEKYQKIANTGGFKKFANNKNLWNFYNDNVKENVNWENFDLRPYVNNFLSKIELLRDNDIKPEELFTNPIDENFALDYSSSLDYVEFYNDSIRIVFHDSYSDFLLDLVNLSEDDIHIYNAAVYGDCNSPDYYEDELRYMLWIMDDDCEKKLSEIAIAVGKTELANKIKSNFSEENVINQIIDMIKKIGENYLQELFNEYSSAINRASCESIKDSYNNHFPDGIGIEDGNTLVIDYNILINFLKENPNIQTFSDLKGHNLIDYESDIEDARYEYSDELDREYLNREYFTILDNLYDKIMDDEEIITRVENIKEFENIMKSLKFEINDDFGFYNKVFKISDQKFKKFSIAFRDIDYDNKKVKLRMVNADLGDRSPVKNEYEIPFDEIAEYVYTEKLYESLLSKLKKII